MKKINKAEDFEKFQKDLEEKCAEIKKVTEEIAICSSNLTKINDIFITFTNQGLAGKFFELYNKTTCTRCSIICCCRKHEIEHL